MAQHFSNAHQATSLYCDRWPPTHSRVLALLPLVALLAGCPQEEQTGTTKPYAQGEAKPGAGVRVTAARANWDTGYFEAEVVAALLRELGYDVSSPAAREMSPDIFYPAVASHLVDFWANGWFPLHDAKLKTAVDGLLAKYPPEVVAVYLHAFNDMNEVEWANLKSMLDSDARLQLGGAS